MEKNGVQRTGAWFYCFVLCQWWNLGGRERWTELEGIREGWIISIGHVFSKAVVNFIESSQILILSEPDHYCPSPFRKSGLQFPNDKFASVSLSNFFIIRSISR